LTHRGERAASPASGLFVLSVVIAATTLVATARYGIGLTPDSVTYLDGARSLAAGQGYSQNGTPITSWAPGYSWVLSLGERLGLDALDGARVLAAIAFVATTLLGFLLLRRHVRSQGIVVAGTVVIGCSGVLLGVFKEALSEHLFIIDVLLLLLVLDRLVARPRDARLLVAAVALVWAGFYLRYAGIVLVAFLAAVLLIAWWPYGRTRALLASLAAMAAGLVVPALWMLRNLDAGSGLMGVRQEAASSAPTNAGLTVKILAGWLVFEGQPVLRAGAVVVVLAAAAVAVFAVVRGRPALAEPMQEMWPLVLFVAGYVGYLAATASVVAFASISTRFLSPVFVPAVVVVAWGFERVRGLLRPSARTVLTAIALVWVASNIVWFGARALNAERRGAGGYQTLRWHDSPLMDDVRQLGEDVPIYTNDVPAIEIFAGRDVDISAEKTYFASNQATGQLPGFVRQVECAGRVTLVWFRPNTRPRLYSPEDLAEALRLVPVVERADGVIYDVTPLASGGIPSSTPPCE
jgi:hypothetical protein